MPLTDRARVSRTLIAVHVVEDLTETKTPDRVDLIEQLETLTLKCVHPVETVLFGLRHSLRIAGCAGVLLYLFRGQMGAIPVDRATLGVMLFNAAGANLRHNHLPWGWGLASKDGIPTRFGPGREAAPHAAPQENGAAI